MDVATIRIGMEVDGDKVSRGFAQGTAGARAFGAGVTQAFDQAGLATNKFATTANTALTRAKASFSGLSAGTKILGGIGLGVGALALGLTQVISPAIEFESAFAGVLKTVNGSTGQLAAIRDGLLDLSTVMPTSAADLASIAENAGQLGVEAGNVLEFTKVIAQLGETTDLSFDSAAQSLARFLNITGSGAGAITKVADVIVDLGNNSATTESQIVGFATRLASAFTVAGASEAEILGVAAAFSSLGLAAEAGGSSLSRIITTIADAATDGGRRLEVLAQTAGVLPEEFARIAAASPVDALLLFGEGLGAVADAGGSLSPIFKAIELEGLRTNEVFRLLALNTELVAASVGRAKIAYAQGGAAAEEYGKRAETTAARLAILQNRITAVAIAAGTPFLSNLAKGADTAGDAISRLAEIMGPLAAAVFDTFGTGGGLADSFFDKLGGPAASGAADTLDLIVSQLVALINTLNSLGPLGLVITGLVADILLVGPASQAAAAAITAVGTAGGGAAGALKLAQTGVAGFVAGLNPVVLAAAAVGGALFLMSRQLGQVKDAADETTSSLTGGLNAALEEGDYSKFADELGVAEAALADLRGELDDVGPVERFNLKLNEMAPLLFGASDEALELSETIKRLQGEIETEEIDRFNNRVQLLADQFGLTRDQVLETTDALEISNLLVDGSVESYELLKAGVEGATLAATAYGDELDALSLGIVNGTASTEDFLASLGTTTAELNALVNLLPTASLEVDKLFSPETEERAQAYADATDLINIQVARLAEQLGITSEAFREQVQVLSDVEAAYANANDAMANVESQLDAIWEAEKRVAEASQAVVEGLQNINSAADLSDAAEAQRAYSLQLAATGESLTDIEARQRLFEQALRDAAAEAGIFGPAIEEAIARSRIPEAQLAAVQSYGQIWKDQARVIQASLGDVEIGLSGAIGLAEMWAVPWEADIYQEGAEEAQAETESATKSAIEWSIPWEANVYQTGAQGAQRETESATAAAGDWAGLWEAEIREIGAANAKSSIDTTTGAAEGYSGGSPYNATMRVNNTQALSGISEAVNALGGFVSKTISLTTNTINRVTSIFSGSSGGTATTGGGRGSSTFSAPRPTTNNNIRRFADGGMAIAAAMPVGAIRQQPGRAQIYTPVTPGRFFAEPETGGEAYIPMGRAKRSTAIPVWEEAGRLLGVLANGGIQSSAFANGGISRGTGAGSNTRGAIVTIQAPIDLQIDARGMDPEQLGEVISTKVQEGFQEVAYDLANAIR